VGSDETRYLYGLDLLGHLGDNGVRYYGYDALSVRLHLNNAGELAADYRYGPFGEVLGEGPAGYGFSGERYDAAPELVYLRARYYQPETGRFLSRDSWPGDYATPGSLHRFGYVGANPVNWVDPSGHRRPWPKWEFKIKKPSEDDWFTQADEKVFRWFRFGLRSETLTEWSLALIGGEIDWEKEVLTVSPDPMAMLPGPQFIGPPVGWAAGAADDFAGAMLDDVLDDFYGQAADNEVIQLNDTLLPLFDDFLNDIDEMVGMCNLWDDSINAVDLGQIPKPDNLFVGTGFHETEVHHIVSQYPSQWPADIPRLLRKYNLTEKGEWNLIEIPHSGSHPAEYHQWLGKKLTELDLIAQGDQSLFLELFYKHIRRELRMFPEMLDKWWWAKIK
jgi:RHS repeat-associated protein